MAILIELEDPAAIEKKDLVAEFKKLRDENKIDKRKLRRLWEEFKTELKSISQPEYDKLSHTSKLSLFIGFLKDSRQANQQFVDLLADALYSIPALINAKVAKEEESEEEAKNEEKNTKQNPLDKAKKNGDDGMAKRGTIEGRREREVMDQPAEKTLGPKIRGAMVPDQVPGRTEEEIRKARLNLVTDVVNKFLTDYNNKHSQKITISENQWILLLKTLEPSLLPGNQLSEKHVTQALTSVLEIKDGRKLPKGLLRAIVLIIIAAVGYFGADAADGKVGDGINLNLNTGTSSTESDETTDFGVNPVGAAPLEPTLENLIEDIENDAPPASTITPEAPVEVDTSQVPTEVMAELEAIDFVDKVKEAGYHVTWIAGRFVREDGAVFFTQLGKDEEADFEAGWVSQWGEIIESDNPGSVRSMQIGVSEANDTVASLDFDPRVLGDHPDVSSEQAAQARETILRYFATHYPSVAGRDITVVITEGNYSGDTTFDREHIDAFSHGQYAVGVEENSDGSLTVRLSLTNSRIDEVNGVPYEGIALAAFLAAIDELQYDGRERDPVSEINLNGLFLDLTRTVRSNLGTLPEEVKNNPYAVLEVKTK